MGCELGKLASSSTGGNKKDIENGCVSEPAAPAAPDPRLPFTARQKYTMVASWKGISRAIETTGVNMFIKWTDLWLNEGLATLYQYYIPHLLYPDDGYMEWFRQRELQQAFRADLVDSVPMSHYVESPKDITGRFDDISYSKGGAVMRMFQEALSVPTFTKGLRRYLEKMKFKAATPSDLFASIQEAMDEDHGFLEIDIPKIMGSWIYQAGYPVVSVSKNGSNLIFKQQRFINGSEIYSVPLTFATKSNPNFESKTFKIFLTEREMVVPQVTANFGPNDWIILNIQQVGYYRTSYSSELWLAISSELQKNFNNIPLISREVLAADLFNGFVHLEDVSAADVLEVLLYIVYEENTSIWSTSDMTIYMLKHKLFGTAAHDEYLKYLQFITKTQLERLGLEDMDGETLEQSIMRSMLKSYNCYALDDFCLEHEEKKLQQYMQNDEYPAPDFCAAFRNASMNTFVQFLNEILSKPDLKNRHGIVNGLSCSLIRSNLDILINLIQIGEFSHEERIIFIGNMLISSPIGLEVAFEYLERNIEELVHFSMELKKIVNTQKYAEKLNTLLFYAIEKGFISTEDGLDIWNHVEANLKWQEKHLEGVKEWFVDFDERIKTIGPPTEEPTTTIETTKSTDGSNRAFESISLLIIGFILMKIIQ